MSDYSSAAVNDESETPTSTEPAFDDTADAGGSTPPEAADAPVAEKDPLEEAKADVARLRDQLLRTAADFDNFRKRSRKETRDAEIQGREDMLRELLPVFDNLERAALHAEKATDVQGLADGVKMVLRIFFDTLTKMDVHRVESVGKGFDPAVHEAIQQMESTEYPPGIIAAEVQPGYRAGDRLLGPAMVVVARAPAAVAPQVAAGDAAGDEPSEKAQILRGPVPGRLCRRAGKLVPRFHRARAFIPQTARVMLRG
ncbi:MAG TPA: nucleotide exchange factor GrpE [Polyangiaceae bacterium]|nr:nucleotide exchange factor GrpE [Polyangiaceae bacterium]